MVRCPCVSLAISRVQSPLDRWHHVHPLANIAPLLLQDCPQSAHPLTHHPLTCAVRPGRISHRKPVFHPQHPLERLRPAVLEMRSSVAHPYLRHPQSLTPHQQMLRSRRCRAQFRGFRPHKLLKSSIMAKMYLNQSPSSNPSLPRGPLSPTYKLSKCKTSPGLVPCTVSPSGRRDFLARLRVHVVYTLLDELGHVNLHAKPATILL